MAMIEGQLVRGTQEDDRESQPDEAKTIWPQYLFPQRELVPRLRSHSKNDLAHGDALSRESVPGRQFLGPLLLPMWRERT